MNAKKINIKRTIENKIVNFVMIITNNKRAYFKINNNNEIIYSKPFLMPEPLSEKFLKENLLKMVKKQRIKKENKPYSLEQGWVILFGQYYQLIFEFGRGYQINKKIITIKGKNIQLAFQNFIKKESLLILDIAKKLFINEKIQANVQIKKLTRVWGNCHAQTRKINLSSRLIHFELNIISYVIVHEIVHLYVQNHQKIFWLEVKKRMDNYKEYRKQLVSW